MPGPFRPDPDYPGLYEIPANLAQDPPGSGLYSPAGLAEDPPGSGLYAFDELDLRAPQFKWFTPDGKGQHRLEVFFELVDLVGPFASVWRTADGRRQEVRGGVLVSTGSSIRVVDHEVPPSRTVSYQLEFYDGRGRNRARVGLSPSGSYTTPEFCSIHNIFEPSQGLEYKPIEGAFRRIPRTAPGSLRTPEGSALPVFIGGRMSGVTVALDCATDSFAEADVLSGMFGTYSEAKTPILVIRTPPRFRVPGTLIVAATEPEEIPLTNFIDGGEEQHWSFTGVEVEPPSPGLAEPDLLWADVEAAYSTWAEVEAAYSRWSDLERDYSLASGA